MAFDLKGAKLQSAPLVRARCLKNVCDQVATLPDQQREAIEKHISSATRKEIDYAGILSWLPVSMDIEIVQAIRNGSTPEQADAFFRGYTTHAMSSPLLKAFVSGVLRISGRTPGTLFKYLPQGFSTLYQNYGNWETRIYDNDSARGMFLDIAEPIINEASYIEALRLGLHGFLDFLGYDGKVEITQIDNEKRRAEFHFEWAIREQQTPDENSGRSGTFG